MAGDLVELLRLDIVSLDTKACINYANMNSSCQICVDTCPNQAINFEKHAPTINQDKCIDCGLCISNCPTLAIDHLRNPYSEISKQIDQYPNANITCEQYADYQKGIKLPCYLYLDTALLTQYSENKKTVQLYLGKCEYCQKANVNQVKNHLSAIQDRLSALQIPLLIQFISTELDDKNDQAIKGFTRRELLQEFSLKKIREKLSEREGFTRRETTLLTVKDRSLFKRKLLNRRLKKAKASKSISLPANDFISIKEVDDCIGCNICEQICPTGAISWRNQEGENKLYFSVQACISCKKCLACPLDSIQFENITLDKYLLQGDKLIKSLQPAKCSECGESFRTSENKEICSYCEMKKRKNPSRFFT